MSGGGETSVTAGDNLVVLVLFINIEIFIDPC